MAKKERVGVQTRKWLYAAICATVILAAFFGVAVADFDGDGAKGWDEIFAYGSNPFVHNSAINYAISRGVTDAHLLNMVLQLEADGLDNSEKAFVDFVSGLEETSQQKVVNCFLADGVISDEEKELVITLDYLSKPSKQKLVDVFFSDEIISDKERELVETLVDFVSGLEETSQQKVVNCFLADGVISDEEKELIYTLRYLSKPSKQKLVDFLIADEQISNEEIKLVETLVDFVSGLEETSQQKVVNCFLADGVISDEEKELAGTLDYLSKPSQQKLVDVFFSDERLDEDEKKITDFLDYIRADLIPEDAKKYYVYNEVMGYDDIGTIQTNFIDSVLENGKIDEVELQTLPKLATERWYVARDIINSTMINSKVLSEDWDGDLKDNLAEILQGTNPLNKLENDPTNLSRRFAVLVASAASQDDEYQSILAGIDLSDLKDITKYLVRNGYTNDNVLLIIDPGPNYVEEAKSLPIQPDFLVKYNIDGQAISGSREAEATYFLEQTRNLPSDGNDLVFISVSTHGNPFALLIGRSVLMDEINTALQFRYGEAIMTIDACYAGNFVEGLNKFYGNPNLLLIAGGFDIHTTSLVGSLIIEGLNSGLSAQESFERFVSEANISEDPVIFSGRTEPFINPLVYAKSETS